MNFTDFAKHNLSFKLLPSNKVYQRLQRRKNDFPIASVGRRCDTKFMALKLKDLLRKKKELIPVLCSATYENHPTAPAQSCYLAIIDQRYRDIGDTMA
jgi:hypothetical protein